MQMFLFDWTMVGISERFPSLCGMGLLHFMLQSPIAREWLAVTFTKIS